MLHVSTHIYIPFFSFTDTRISSCHLFNGFPSSFLMLVLLSLLFRLGRVWRNDTLDEWDSIFKFANIDISVISVPSLRNLLMSILTYKFSVDFVLFKINECSSCSMVVNDCVSQLRVFENVVFSAFRINKSPPNLQVNWATLRDESDFVPFLLYVLSVEFVVDKFEIPHVYTRKTEKTKNFGDN